MPIRYEGKVRMVYCPHCKRDRPYDFFVSDSDACWNCRGIHKELRGNLKQKDIGEEKRRELKRKRATGEKF